MSRKSAWEFVKGNIFFLLGGICIVIVGLLFIVSRGGEAQVVRNGDNALGMERVVGEYVIGEVDEQSDGLASDIMSNQVNVATGGHATELADGQNIIENQPVAITGQLQETLPAAYIGIHIIGAVYTPGFFMLPADARVNCVVERAGGLTAYADIARVNLAEFLRDGMQIIIPAEGEDVDEVLIFSQVATNSGAGGVQAGGSGVQGGGAQDTVNTTAQRGITPSGLVNINFANSTELQTLTGVGPTIAQNIIDFRETHGLFASVDELIHVSRIGVVTLENLRASVTVYFN